VQPEDTGRLLMGYLSVDMLCCCLLVCFINSLISSFQTSLIVSANCSSGEVLLHSREWKKIPQSRFWFTNSHKRNFFNAFHSDYNSSFPASLSFSFFRVWKMTENEKLRFLSLSLSSFSLCFQSPILFYECLVHQVCFVWKLYVQFFTNPTVILDPKESEFILSQPFLVSSSWIPTLSFLHFLTHPLTLVDSKTSSSSTFQKHFLKPLSGLWGFWIFHSV